MLYSNVETENEPAGIGDSETATPKKPNTCKVLIGIADMVCEYWTDERNTPYVTIDLGTHKINIKIESSYFRTWLSSEYYNKCSNAPDDRAKKSAIEILCHKAREGATHKTYLRYARIDDTLFIDLGNDKWEAIEVSGDGWKIVNNPPVKFRRTPIMATMPLPNCGGNIEALKPFVHTTPENWILLLGYLLDAMKGHGPYFALAVNGEQGSAKSSLCRFIRQLIDPVSSCPLSSPPRDEMQFAAKAKNTFLLAFDNLSYIKPWLSDLLCRAATGGGIDARKLYSDDDINIVDVECPVVFNGIPEIVSASDLLSRCIILTQPVIDPSERREEKQLNKEFEAIRSTLFGSLLDMLSNGLRTYATLELKDLSRMADSVKWVTACFGNNDFIDRYRVSENDNITQSLENSPVCSLLPRLVKTKWEGTAEKLLQDIKNIAAYDEMKMESFPKTAKGMASAIRREAPAMRAAWNWIVIERRSHGKNLITLDRPIEPNQPVQSIQPELTKEQFENSLRDEMRRIQMRIVPA